ncbi:MAG: hypothetical protein OXI34_17120 [Chloroflexota bacterium]|nr:hypothetical protein [Chloroflexota bacterium]MDE2854926.1 hypothetical protein [Chloroflexota bacterium]MDE2949003.1 hypothetical protein [Chloroflexota bacterium]
MDSTGGGFFPRMRKPRSKWTADDWARQNDFLFGVMRILCIGLWIIAAFALADSCAIIHFG